MSPIGLASGTVRLESYDELWPQYFAKEVAAIQAVLASRGLSLTLEHTGSTAVPGLCAKPIIDILAGRDELTSRTALIAAIASAGYTYRGEQGILGRDFFRRGEPRSYHLHLAEIGSDFWNDHRTFRDYLRAHADAASQYAMVKKALARRFLNDREAYILGKTEFVTSTLRAARA